MTAARIDGIPGKMIEVSITPPRAKYQSLPMITSSGAAIVTSH